MSNQRNYVLDTSAIFAFTKDEDGAYKVEEILRLAISGKAKIFVSFATFMEIYYITFQERDERSAQALFLSIKSLPIERIESSERLTIIAGEIKALYRLSVADAFVAATAVEKNAILVHKDPELEGLGKTVRTLQLPYKKKAQQK